MEPQCEINRNFTRSDAIKYFKARFQLVQQLSKSLKGFAILSLITFITLPCKSIVGGNNAGLYLLIGFGFAFLFAASFMVKPTMIVWRAWKKQEPN